MKLLATIAVALLTTKAHGGDDTIPATNHPSNFSGAAGLYTIEMRAVPTTVRVGDPVTLTVKIMAKKPGPWKYPPQREKLKLFANLENSFFVEPLPEEDRFLAAENAWEFSWRLVPRKEGTRTIPAAEFVYYRTVESPGFKIAEGSRSIAVEVKPRAATVFSGPSANRDQVERIVEGDHLLVSDPDDFLWWTIVVASLALPPCACLAGYFAWRQAFPEAAERLRRHRSRALKSALQQLRALAAGPPPDKLRTIVVSYLRTYVNLPAGEPTPAEVQQVLLAQGAPRELVKQAGEWCRRCDGARFAPTSLVASDELAQSAAEIMKNLEAELCAASS